MLKDVGMTVEKQMQYTCSQAGDEGSIYAARWDEASIYPAKQGMRAVYMQQDWGSGQATIITCVTPPYISFVTHVTIVACPHPVWPHIYCICFSTNWHCHL